MLTFQSRLRRFLKKQQVASPADLSGYFLEFYEPTVFGEDELIDGIYKLPRPFRELAAADQAWGMISSDGFENYVEHHDETFDEEVRKGLAWLNREEVFTLLQEARRLLVIRSEKLDARDDLDPFNPEHREEIRRLARLEEDDDDRLFSAFLDTLDQFEDLLGKHLIKILSL